LTKTLTATVVDTVHDQDRQVKAMIKSKAKDNVGQVREGGV
jgi:hypothetical protein